MEIDLAALPDDVEKLQRSQFGRRAERLDDEQLQFGFEDLAADLARAEARLPPSVENTAKARAQVDRPSLPEHLPREDRRLDIEHPKIKLLRGAQARSTCSLSVADLTGLWAQNSIRIPPNCVSEAELDQAALANERLRLELASRGPLDAP
jgi:hypothetical protein